MQWRGAVLTSATLAVTILVIVTIPADRAPTQPSGSTPASTAAPAVARDVLRSSEGFDVEIPPGWVGRVDDRQTNRNVIRLLVFGNRGLEAPDLIPSTWPGVPTDRVIVELVHYSGGPPRFDPRMSTETAFPLNWDNAQDLRADGPFAVRSLTFSHVGRTFGFTAHIGPDAPASDVALLPALVRSLRPQAIPTSGVYRGWRVIGPASSFPVGSVTHFNELPPASSGFFLVRGTNTIFAHMDRAFFFNGGFMNCVVRYESPTKTFVCDRSGDRWSRVGRLLSANPSGSDALGLAYHPVLIKDGLVLVGGSALGGPIVEDEAVEFGDRVTLPAPTAPPTRAEIVAHLSRVTAVDPVERTAAKLVSSDVLRAELFPGLSLRPGPVWVVAFSGPVHSPQGGTSIGNWTLFVADAAGGGVISSRCCDGDQWPAAFDALVDQGG